ncbi:MAG: HlyD family secretion protein [Planctomycetaceae bacterium]
MKSNLLHNFVRLLLVGAVAFLGWAAWQRQERAKIKLPPGIVGGNGRIEAVQVDIATKYSGRIDQVTAKEGKLVTPDEVLCVMDSTEMQADLQKSKAQQLKAAEDVARAAAEVVQKEAAYTLQEKSFARAESLKRSKAIADQDYDEARARRDSSQAAVNVAKAALRSAEQAHLAAEAEVKRQTAQITDMTLKSPVRGRVLYRLAEPGMVLGSGGKVLTVLDLSDIYMEIFLPSQEAGKLRLGSEARFVLDVAPDYAGRARVSFISPEAQFTPKQVETRSERDKLMFRVKLQLPAEAIIPHIDRVKTGLRGVGYVRLDESVEWPAFLQRRFPLDVQPAAGQAPASETTNTPEGDPEAAPEAAKTPAEPAQPASESAPAPATPAPTGAQP